MSVNFNKCWFYVPFSAKFKDVICTFFKVIRMSAVCPPSKLHWTTYSSLSFFIANSWHPNVLSCLPGLQHLLYELKVILEGSSYSQPVIYHLFLYSAWAKNGLYIFNRFKKYIYIYIYILVNKYNAKKLVNKSYFNNENVVIL
jgi:hypothetical protein